MKDFNYQKLCFDLLRNLPPRTKQVVYRRFGLAGNKRETLESIGRSYGITRERTRQIEADGFSKIKPRLDQSSFFKKVSQYFIDHLKNYGELRKEDLLIGELGKGKWENEVYFLLTLGENFKKIRENDDFYSLWTINQDSLLLAGEILDDFYHQLQRVKHPLRLRDFNCSHSLPQPALISYLEISKKIQRNSEGLFGLVNWPEINPRGVKDKAYLVFKKIKKPIHFREIAQFIGKAHPSTVHNELIRDPRFVLVGRGIYALKEWGYQEGQVKDIIFEVLKEAKKPMKKEKILEKVLKQRLVKKNTVLLNLSNRKYFSRDSQGRYTIAKNGDF